MIELGSPAMIQNQNHCLEEMVKTNIGTMPLSDYLDIYAMQHGCDDYDDLVKQGYKMPAFT